MSLQPYITTIMSPLATGDFYAAETRLGERWLGAGVMPPRRSNESDYEYAAILMFCGILAVEYGLMGSRLQERGKDMLAKSIRLFGEDEEGALTATAWLATAYERCGEFHEALAIVNSLLEKNPSLDVVFCATKTKAIAQAGLGSPQQALATLLEIEPLVDAVSPLIQGKFYLQRGLIYRRLEQLDNAIQDYDRAMDCFNDAKSLRYEGVASNNMAWVYMDWKQFSRAHVLAERAISLFRRLGDKNHEGMAWDTNAQIYLREGKFADSVREARKAVSLLEEGDHYDFLAEALTTQGLALVEIGAEAETRLEAGLSSLLSAVNVYETHGNTKQAEGVHKKLLDSVQRTRKTSKNIVDRSHDAERVVISHLLKTHDGRIAPPAATLGLTRRGLEQRLAAQFPDLLAERKPARKRRKSVLKKLSSSNDS